MKIVQLITRMDTLGGAQIHVRDVCLSLKQAGHVVYLIAGGEEMIFKELEENGIEVFCISQLVRDLHVSKDLEAIMKVRTLLKKIQPDLIAIHSSKAGIIGRIAGRSLNIPVVFTAHGWAFTEGVPAVKRLFYANIEKMGGSLSDKVITVSEYDRNLAIMERVLHPKKLLTIHNGVHPSIERSNMNIQEVVELNLVMIARFSPPKNQMDLIEALTKLKHLPWKMMFVGDGERMAAAQKYTAETELEERILFLGNCSDVAAILRKSHIFILLSEYEGLPLSILEAMSCGLPIVASDVGGVKEAVKDTVNGYLIKRDDERSLLIHLTNLITDPVLRYRMGNESLKLYESEFTFNKMMDETMRLYDDIVERNK